MENSKVVEIDLIATSVADFIQLKKNALIEMRDTFDAQLKSLEQGAILPNATNKPVNRKTGDFANNGINLRILDEIKKHPEGLSNQQICENLNLKITQVNVVTARKSKGVNNVLTKEKSTIGNTVIYKYNTQHDANKHIEEDTKSGDSNEIVLH
jgi:hypothetical protein